MAGVNEETIREFGARPKPTVVGRSGAAAFYSEIRNQRVRLAGRYWVRWNEAIAEAGFSPNRLTARRPDDAVLGSLAALNFAIWPHSAHGRNSVCERVATQHFPAVTYFADSATKRRRCMAARAVWTRARRHRSGCHLRSEQLEQTSGITRSPFETPWLMLSHLFRFG